MAEPVSTSTGIATRYATAVFEIAEEAGALGAVESDADALDAALRESGDLRRLVFSPLYSREQTRRAIETIAARMELSATTANTLGLMASKRRLFVLPQFLRVLRAQIAEAKGEITARVTAARTLSDDQRTRLAATLEKTVGRSVKVDTAVDQRLIGGMVVQVGSRMIDTSVRAKLDALENSMKEAG